MLLVSNSSKSGFSQRDVSGRHAQMLLSSIREIRSRSVLGAVRPNSFGKLHFSPRKNFLVWVGGWVPSGQPEFQNEPPQWLSGGLALPPAITFLLVHLGHTVLMRPVS